MSVDKMDGPVSWAPAACTLPTAERPLRVAEFDELFASAVLGIGRRGPGVLRLELDPAEPAAASSVGLVTRETSCCSFFTFILSAIGGRLALEVSVPPERVEVLDGLAWRTASLAGHRS
jgi:hypothetical protein